MKEEILAKYSIIIIWIVFMSSSFLIFQRGLFPLYFLGEKIWIILIIIAIPIFLGSIYGIYRSAKARVSLYGCRDKKNIITWSVITIVFFVGFIAWLSWSRTLISGNLSLIFWFVFIASLIVFFLYALFTLLFIFILKDQNNMKSIKLEITENKNE
jgi:hypothetical protein